MTADLEMYVLIVEGLSLQRRPHAAFRVLTQMVCCVCMLLYVYVCTYTCTYMYVCVYVLIVEGLLLQRRPHAVIRVMTQLVCCVCVLLYVHVFMYAYMYVHVCMYVCVNVLIIEGRSLLMPPSCSLPCPDSDGGCCMCIYVCACLYINIHINPMHRRPHAVFPVFTQMVCRVCILYVCVYIFICVCTCSLWRGFHCNTVLMLTFVS